MRTIVTALLMGAPLTAIAHSGHGSTTATDILHWIVEPIHAAPLVLALGLGIVAVRSALKKRNHKSV
jgi:hypothetical protein